MCSAGYRPAPPLHSSPHKIFKVRSLVVFCQDSRFKYLLIHSSGCDLKIYQLLGVLMRDPNKFTIEKLLTSDDQYAVPEYQRGYDWKSNTQLKDLFMDFEACIDSNHSKDLFLGTMIFDVSQEKNNIIEVIDGQQRLTSLLIVLVACRTFAKDILENEKLAIQIHNSIGTTDELIDDERDQLIASATIKDVFQRICKYDWDCKFPDRIQYGRKFKSVKLQNSRVRPIYQYAFKEIERKCSEDPPAQFKELLRQITKRTYIIKIDIEEQSEAFEIFERTNARGKGLEISDLLKNFLFSKTKEVGEYSIEEAWGEISENAGASILRMLKYFWISRRGKVATRDLYRNIREYAQTNGYKEFVEELREFSSYYSAYMSKDREEFKTWLVGKSFKKGPNVFNRNFSCVINMPFVWHHTGCSTCL